MQSSRRLADFFLPTHYAIDLSIKREERTFSGSVTIAGTLPLQGSPWVHVKDLTVVSCSVNEQEVPFQLHDNDELELTYGGSANEDLVVLINFEGVITDQMHGMYPCYFEHDGSTKELIATQFESHHAREVFPCVDEPAAKATFDVTLETERGITVLGNMPVATQIEAEDRLTTTFERSPKMSTYLLAWVYGELQKKSARTTSGVEINVWATPAQPANALDFALDIAVRSTEFYNDFFGVPYPLPKCDHVALPDFSSGAMENWGLITYREVALLADPATTSVSGKHYIATVIAHELAHQWFGNLVTMQWWNDLWLNESFATLMEYIAIDALEPSWNVWLDFASNESVMALRRDALDGVQSVQVDVRHPDEISTLFDSAIVYAKGARLLRMLEAYIGKSSFQKGLQEYFTRFRYQNTVADDLWNSLESASGKPIAALMNTWISQPGYPVVTVADGTLTQEQFFIGEHVDSNRLWPVPLGSDDDTLPELMIDASLTADMTITSRLNVDDSAHFITRYEPARLIAILADIEHATPLSRLQLMHEQSLLARGGLNASHQLVPLLRSYRYETTESVWDIMALTFSELKKFVESNEPATLKLRSLAAELAERQYAKLGWDQQPGETESDTKQRATILGMMLYSERKDVVAEAIRRFDNAALTAIPAEIRPLIISTKVKFEETPELVSTLLDSYRTTSSSDLKQDICAGLTATKHSDTAQLLLDTSKNSKIIKNQDAFRWFVYLVRSPYSRETAWNWLQDNWSWVKQTFGGDKSYDDYPRYAAAGLVTPQQLHEYEEFFAPMREEPSLARTITLGISEIKAKIDLIERDRAEVVNILTDQTISQS